VKLLQRLTRRLKPASLMAFGAAIAFGLFWLTRYSGQLLRQPKMRLPALPPNLPHHPTDESRARAIAEANLHSGIEPRRLANGRTKLVLCAGRRNFREPWARDFGFAAFGLTDLGEFRAAKETLEVFLAHQRPSGQFPVKIHSTRVLNRYLHTLFGREQPTHAPLRPKYITAHNTISLDGNALLVIAFLHVVRRSGDHAFAAVHWPAVRRALRWVQRHAHPDGLLHQSAFADWADSVDRSGKVLYPNVVYWKALHDMAAAAPEFGFAADGEYFARQAEAVGQAINRHFWRDEAGYYVTSRQFDQLSSSGNLLAAAWGLASAEQAHSILNRMRDFGMADPVPTRVTHRPYPNRFIALENRLGGIAHYHTCAAWLWLGGWHVIALARLGRLAEARELLARLSRVIVRDGAVHEVYDPAGHVLSTRWYTAEAPLTWSAGMVTHAFHQVERAPAQFSARG